MISLYHSTIIVNESFNKGYLNREEYENKVKEGMSKKVQSKIKFNYSIADLRPPKGNICSDEYALLNDFIKSKTNVRIINRKYSCHTETGNKPRIDTDLPDLPRSTCGFLIDIKRHVLFNLYFTPDVSGYLLTILVV